MNSRRSVDDSNNSGSAANGDRARRALGGKIKRTFRVVNNQIALLAHHVSTQIELRDIDLHCLDYLAENGPTTPSALGRQAGVHPATMTGVIDRLEKGGWIQRQRDDQDRRAVLISARADALGAVFRQYDGMNAQMDGALAEYSPEELEIIAKFLERTAAAARRAVAEFVDSN
jgi:DNA-binding MarR family transcriptional regulator